MMDILFLIIAVLLSLSFYYNISYKRHLPAGNNQVRKTSGLHAKGVKLKENLKKKRKHVSTQSDLSDSQIPVQMSNIDERGSDETSGTEDERDNASTDSCDNNTVFEQMIGPDIDISKDDYKIYSKFVNKEELTMCISQLGLFQGLCQYAMKQNYKWKNRKVKIAIAGNSGTGKSSLINALRGIRPDDEGAAQVGVTETTTKPVTYSFPKNNRILIVDLPGMGTKKFPKENYMKDMEVSTYDAFIIVASGRITENDVWFVKETMNNNKHVLFVRTKIDMDLSNEKHDNPKRFSEVSCLAKIRKEIEETLYNELQPDTHCRVYLVSSRERDRHDFAKLEKTLKIMLNGFGRAIRLKLSKHIEAYITEKKELNKGQFRVRKCIAFLNGFIPGNKYNLSTPLEEVRQVCLRHFFLDQQSLAYVASEIHISVSDIKKELKSFDEEEKDAATSKNPLLKYFKQINRYYLNVKENLSRMCEVMAKDEMTLIGKKLDIIEEELSLL